MLASHSVRSQLKRSRSWELLQVSIMMPMKAAQDCEVNAGARVGSGVLVGLGVAVGVGVKVGIEVGVYVGVAGSGVLVGEGVVVGVGVNVGIAVCVLVGAGASGVSGAGMRAKSSVNSRLIGKVKGQPKQTSSVSSVITA